MNANRLHRRRWFRLLISASSVLTAGLWHTSPARAASAAPHAVLETWSDTTRQRALPLAIRWPKPGSGVPGGGALRPLVLFSHGLGGNRDGGRVYGEAWSAAGFVVVHLQHPGSDTAALPERTGLTGTAADSSALRHIASPQQLINRIRDVRFVLDEVARRHRAGEPGWHSVRTLQVGMSGHSLGAHTTLGVAGQRYPALGSLGDERLAAFVALSPTAPLRHPQAAFAGIDRPLLSITGTRDGDLLGNGATPANRLSVYGHLPAGHKAHLVLKDADHMSFAGQPGLHQRAIARDPSTLALESAHHAVLARITTDWWLTHLAADPDAAARLAQPLALQPGDRWEQR